MDGIQKITVIGAGQIGTSLVIAIARKHPDAEIVALDVDSHVQIAFAAKLAAFGLPAERIAFTTNPGDAAKSQVVILATPVSEFGSALKQVNPYLESGAIVTDVGSVKQESIRNIQAALRRDSYYVPCHPLNGNAGSGPATASDKMFEGKPLILVPDHAPKTIEDTIEKLWQSLGAKVLTMSAVTHDRILGTTSHLEHLIMFAWMRTADMRNLVLERGLDDPGNWIQGMTRIADASPEMWIPIFEGNGRNINATAVHFAKGLQNLAQRLKTGNYEELGRRIAAARDYAASMPSANIKPLDCQDERNPEIRTAFAGLLSLAITENVMRIEHATGQRIAPIANPSIKDGMGPVALEPSLLEILKANAPALARAAETYLADLRILKRMVANIDSAPGVMHAAIDEISIRRRLMKGAFAPPPDVGRPQARIVPGIK